ncbi:MAG TPA: 5-carboxymethyl-2-hydroxymuconate isomerase [Chloroflexi bacterium]|nr:5-carboxymethyl-2-hydroxymuconate isomerase [Chloroflexota bacterium]
MRLVMYQGRTGKRPGALEGESVIDLCRASEDLGSGSLPGDLRGLIEAGPEALAYVRHLTALPEVSDRESKYRLTLGSVRLLAPLDPPAGNVVAIGRNYGEHAREQAAARGESIERPTIFTKAQTSITGPYDDISIDQEVTTQVDWEAELGVVLGRRGRDIPIDESMGYVFGYTVLNDLSARDIQYGWGGQFFKGKSLDSFCPSGPCIVTADEVADPQNLRIRLKVNGEIKQDASTSDMIFPVSRLVAELSVGMTVLPATLIATGTPSGVGYARQPPEFLKPGDVVETEVQDIGTIRNRIVEAG